MGGGANRETTGTYSGIRANLGTVRIHLELMVAQYFQQEVLEPMEHAHSRRWLLTSKSARATSDSVNMARGTTSLSASSLPPGSSMSTNLEIIHSLILL